MENMGILHPEDHIFSNRGITINDPDGLGAIMTQLSLNAGLKRWGNKGLSAINSNMNQLHMRDTLLPLQCNNM